MSNNQKFIILAMISFYMLSWFYGCAKYHRSYKEDSKSKVAAPSSYRMEKKRASKSSADIDPLKTTGDQDKLNKPEIKLEAARRLATSDKYRSRIPELLARINSPDMKPLPLKSQDISIVVVGHRVRVVQDLTFQNPSNQVLAGTLMIEMPDGASPSYLGMFQGQGVSNLTSAKTSNNQSANNSQKYIPWLNPKTPGVKTLLAKEIKLAHSWQGQGMNMNWGELRSAKVVNPIKGRQVYESIVRRRIDPALSEWAGSGKFSTRVFPIPAKGYKRVVFAYDLSLKVASGSVVHNLPLAKKIKARTRINIHSVGKQYKNSVIFMGKNKLKAKKANYGRKWQLRPKSNIKGSLIFQGRFKQPQLQVISGRDGKISGQFLHILYQPKLKIKKKKTKTGQALFIIDTSYSSKDKLYSQSGKMLRAILENDESISRFAIIGFDVAARRITRGFVNNTRSNQERLLTKIENIWLEGATNFGSVLEMIRKDSALKRVNTIFLLSDGHITWGINNTRKLETAFSTLMKKRWLCYSFGNSSVNRDLFNTLSRTRGQIVHVAPGQKLSFAALAHRRQSSQLRSVRAQGNVELIAAGNPKQIYPGQVLELAARANDNIDTLNAVFNINGKNRKVTIPVATNLLTNQIASRSWADLYAKRLLTMFDETADNLLIALSQHFSLTNRQASFIILETDKEYMQHKINTNHLDLQRLTAVIKSKSAGQDYGAPKINDLSSDTVRLLNMLKTISKTRVWLTRKPLLLKNTFTDIRRKPGVRGKNNQPRFLYEWALSLAKKKSLAQALRIISTIIELKPKDDKAARMVAYVLMNWDFYKQAADLFAQIRRRRPFEPQSYLLEGMALAAQGNAHAAAVRYEIVLKRSFPRFDAFVKPVAKLLYQDLLMAVINQHSQSEAVRLAKKRLSQIGLQKYPAGRLLLFWNLDNVDVDLHVQEPNGDEVNYKRKQSSSGGKLYWDNTRGLGPELYEHISLASGGYSVSVNYFGSRSVEGMAPSTTLVFTCNSNPNGKLPIVKWYTTVLIGQKGGKIRIMPLWKK